MDPYIGGVWAGYKNKSIAVTTSYQLIIPANASRSGWTVESDVANMTTITLKYGTTEWTLSGGGSFSRHKKTGSNVAALDLYAKGASGGELLTAEET